MNHETAPRAATAEGSTWEERGALRPLDPEVAAARWAELLRGHWTIVAKIDEGERLLVLARRSGEVSPSAALTYRERQIAHLAAQGTTIKDIADALGVTSSTAATHLATAMRKLGVHTRGALVALLG